jgi:hypothetical protein
MKMKIKADKVGSHLEDLKLGLERVVKTCAARGRDLHLIRGLCRDLDDLARKLVWSLLLKAVVQQILGLITNVVEGVETRGRLTITIIQTQT